MISLAELIEWLKTALNYELLHLGDSQFMTKTFILIALSFFQLVYLSSKIRKIPVNKIFPRYNLNIVVSQFFPVIKSTVDNFEKGLFRKSSNTMLNNSGF